jgi:hypothetical protein
MNTKTKAIIAYLIVLLAGFAAGYTVHFLQSPATGNQWEQPEWQGQWEHDRGRMGQEMGVGRRANERLSRQLALEQEQKEPFFREIWEFHRGVRNEIHSRRENERELIRERYNVFREEVSEFLTEEQLVELDRIAHPDSVESRRPFRGPRR